MEDVDLVLRVIQNDGLYPAVGPRSVRLQQRLAGDPFRDKVQNEIETIHEIESKFDVDVVSRLRRRLEQDQKS